MAPPTSFKSQSALVPPAPATQPPQWLSNAVQTMQARYPKDKFEAILCNISTDTNGMETVWRMKCFDCPGKWYTPGPGETLSNYEVHLKNRLHRQRVNERVTSATTTRAKGVAATQGVVSAARAAKL